MRAFTSKPFDRWASKEGLTDAVLWRAVEEIEAGQVDASLGGHLYKKRVALRGRGKRGGGRVLLVYRAGDLVFFVRGFAKSARANIDRNELDALRGFAKKLLNYDDRELDKLVESGRFRKVEK